jgi:4-amino-4-deoxy-L-arabinose transferase-like glycosyltransferase
MVLGDGAGLRDWLRVLWLRVLFPGTGACAERLALWRCAVLLILPALLLYPCLSFYLFEPDEGRYAEIPREMLERGDWIVPSLQGEPYLDKPPLFYWLVAVSYCIFGVHDWAARVVPALAMHLCVLSTFLLGRRSLGERTAFWGALILLLTPGFLGIGRLLLLDGLLALWVGLALLCGLEAVRTTCIARRWWVAAAGACGLGVLTKGPVVLVLVLPPLWLERRLIGHGGLGGRSLLLFFSVVALLNLPWYLAVSLRMPEFAQHFLWTHNIVRFTAPFDHQQPVWYYVPILLLGLLPWSFCLPALVRHLTSGVPAVRETRRAELGFWTLAAAWCLLFFSLSGCKLPTYILPAYIPLALLLGSYAAHRFASATRRKWLLLTAGLGVQAAGHFLFVPWYAELRSPLRHWQALAEHCGDAQTPVVCYPRHAHSVAFYLRRDDLRHFRSKQIHELRAVLAEQPKTVILLTHRHSLQGLRETLPPQARLVHAVHFGLEAPAFCPDSLRDKLVRCLGTTALNLCDLAIVEWSTRRAAAQPPTAAK